MGKRGFRGSGSDHVINCFSHTANRASNRFDQRLTFDDIHRMGVLAKREGDEWRFVCRDGPNQKIGLVFFKKEWLPIVYNERMETVKTILPPTDFRIQGWDLKTGTQQSQESISILDENTPRIISDWVNDLMGRGLISSARVRPSRNSDQDNSVSKVWVNAHKQGVKYSVAYQNRRWIIDIMPFGDQKVMVGLADELRDSLLTSETG